ncbi:MAG: hypothetical protein ABIE70_01465 [bacterium]
MKLFLTLAAVALIFTAASPAIAQDEGVPDTVALEFSVVPDFTTNQLLVQADLWVFNDGNNVQGAGMGFSWDNPNMQMDSAVASPVVTGGFEIGPFFYENSDINVTNANLRFLFGGAVMFGAGIPPDPNRRLWASYYFTMSGWNLGDEINIDTLQFSTSTTYKFVGPGGDYFPVWAGPLHHHDTAEVIPVNLIIIPDSMHFDATEGAGNPASQNIEFTTDGDPVDFTVGESIPWAQVNPVLGTTPQTGLVSVNIGGLTAGSYIDSFSVTAPDADNSPQWVVLTLDLVEPPPEIAVNPDELFFNAVAGEANPDPKMLTITNAGGMVLNWSVSHSQSWLSPAPMSGTDSGAVTVSVDITGLSMGDYYDTIVVSDPAASNDPLLVPVNLSIGSDLPIIEVTPGFVPVIVQTPATTIDPQTISLTNGGAGVFSFWFEENSPRIVGFNPATGSSPQDVEVLFDPAGGVYPQNFYDTVWVHSNEAINSPVPVVFWFHFTNDPAILTIIQDTLRLKVYECGMGYGHELPSATFFAYNLGGDNPVNLQLYFDSTQEFFTLSNDIGVLPEEFTVYAQWTDVPVGHYYDTIWVYAPKALNSPHMLIVDYFKSEADQAPVIYLPKNETVAITQENSGPSPESNFEIWNSRGGCMDFVVVEDIPWLFLNDQEGTAPEAIKYRVNSSGFPLGTYIDTFFIYADGATNSPRPVKATMHVFRYYGDCDWNGEINIVDLVYLVNYMFNEGPAPMPWYTIGSMDCNPVVTIVDLIWLVDWMFNGGPKPCGNP